MGGARTPRAELVVPVTRAPAEVEDAGVATKTDKELHSFTNCLQHLRQHQILLPLACKILIYRPLGHLQQLQLTLRPSNVRLQQLDHLLHPNRNRVHPLQPRHYDFVTTSDGILQKKDNTDPEFVVDGTLETLLRQRDFGRYADASGDLVLCFISNNDITGGIDEEIPKITSGRT